MPFARPTLADLRAQTQADLGSSALLRFSNTRVIADILAMGAYGLYGYLDWIAREAVPFTATDEHLEAWAALKGVGRKAATAAAGSVTFSGTPTTQIASGLSVTRADGVAFVTTSAATIGGGGTIDVPVQASAPGADGNTDAGAVFSLSNQLGGVSGGVAAAAFTGGADVESDDELRTRMLLAYSQPPQGGALTDYLGWIQEVTGVTRAWVAPGAMGPGTIVAYFMLDDAESGHGGFPQGSDGVASAEPRDIAATGDQLAVANHLFTLCSVTTLVYATAPKANAVSLTITGLSGTSDAVKAAIEAALTALFVAKGSPGGVRLVSGATGGLIQLADVNAAINGVAGSAGFAIGAMSASHGAASPISNITSSAGYLPVLGSVSFP